jgi:hypothetical protein
MIRPKSLDFQLDQDKLIELRDWNFMTPRKELRYNVDFVLVSASVWKFLVMRYGGGNQIFKI